MPLEIITSHLHESSDTKEKTRSCEIVDLSGLEPWFVSQQVEHILPFANKIVVFPDLGPTEKGVVPTGSVTEINIAEHPNWPELVKGADIGCGMIMASIQIDKDTFQKRQDLLDEVHKQIKENSSISLGGGNHFIDFVSDSEGRIYVVIHTGAYRDKQKNLSKIITERPTNEEWSKTTEKYVDEYNHVITSADKNRKALLDIVYKVYAAGTTIFHEAHNTIELNSQKNTVTIYKGVIHVTDTTKKLLLPSSMDSRMDLYTPGKRIGSETLWGAPHGTGRRGRRSEMKSMEIELPNIMLVTGTTPPRTEMPDAYRSITSTETTMLNNGLMKLEEQGDILELTPIAYIGHI